MSKRWLLVFGALVLASALVACGGGDDGDGGGPSDGGGSGGGGGGDQTVEPVDSDELSYVVMTPLGLSRISAESGKRTRWCPGRIWGCHSARRW